MHIYSRCQCIFKQCFPSKPWQFLATSSNTGCNINLKHDCKTPTKCLSTIYSAYVKHRIVNSVSHTHFIYVLIIIAWWVAMETSMAQRTINEYSKREPRVFAVICRYLPFLSDALCDHLLCYFKIFAIQLLLVAFRIIIYWQELVYVHDSLSRQFRTSWKRDHLSIRQWKSKKFLRKAKEYKIQRLEKNIYLIINIGKFMELKIKKEKLLFSTLFSNLQLSKDFKLHVYTSYFRLLFSHSQHCNWKIH